MTRHANRQQLGELAVNFLDMLDVTPGPVYVAGFVAICKDAETGKRSIVTRTTSDDSSANVEMFHDAATVEHFSFVKAAEAALQAALGEDE